MEVEAELVHCCHRGSHRPSQPRALPRQAHVRHDRRGEEQPRGHAVAATTRDRYDPKSRKSRSGHGSSVKHFLLARACAHRAKLANVTAPQPVPTTSVEARMNIVV